MKALGIIRKVDELGRVVIPKEVRKTQGWEAGQPLEMFMEGNKIVMQAYGKEMEKQALIQAIESADTDMSRAAALDSVLEYLKGE